ncbi:hypothetical protein ES703_15116 [subsurface metagenome]
MAESNTLQQQIKYVEDNIKLTESLGKDASFERELVKELKRYLPGGDKHHLWAAYSANGSHLKHPPANCTPPKKRG